jgi:hypothetical protein
VQKVGLRIAQLAYSPIHTNNRAKKGGLQSSARETNALLVDVTGKQMNRRKSGKLNYNDEKGICHPYTGLPGIMQNKRRA